MIDFHNHILPNIDDGSKSLEVSLKMLECAHNQGITDVVNTVHFQHPKVEGFDISYDSIKRATSDLQKELDDIKLPIKLHIGAEVYYQPNLLKIKDNPLLNRVVLLKTQFSALLAKQVLESYQRPLCY